ncbi:flagellar biosynthetic protein FliR [Bradyrhizobium diazoefficiens]
MLTILFLPIPPILIDLGLAFSIALSALILMVALWIQRPLDFSAFPTVLLIATILRLALNVATTRLILSRGGEGEQAAGHVVAGFSKFVMGGDFVIGLIIFAILVTVNFVVITKGATRIAEVGARFTLDAIPGKQMAIDADLSAGLIDDKEAQRRRRELEEESAFFGAMDGASKFVRGDAIAGLIITAINIFGGIIIGVTHHGLTLSRAADVYTKLSVGDGLVSQMPALIVSLSAGLLVSKGGTRGSAEQAVLRQLSGYPRAVSAAALMMFVLAIMPGLPMAPFVLLGGVMAFVGYTLPRRQAARDRKEDARKADERAQTAAKESVKESLKTAEIELALGGHLSVHLLGSRTELGHRVAKIRKKFAKQYGFVIPEIKLTDNLSIDPKGYQIRIHDTRVAHGELRLGEVLVLVDKDGKPDVPGEEVDRTRLRHEGAVGDGGFHRRSQATGLQTGRQSVGSAHASERGDQGESRPAPVLQGHARAARPARSRIQAPDRGSLPVTDFLFGPAGDPEDPAGRARVDPQSPSDPRGDRGDRAPCAALRTGGGACPHAACPADLRRPLRQRRAQRGPPRQSLGSRLPPEPEARPQGGRRRIRRRSAPDRAVRDGSQRGDPQVHRERHQRGAGGDPGGPSLCPDDPGTGVPDTAGPVACGGRAQRRDQSARSHIVISSLADSVLVTFIVFCRIGACLMFVPGYSSVNVPAQVRLFIALVTTFALTPILIAVLKPLTDQAAPLTLALLIGSEVLVGSVIGLGGRVFFLALQTMATVMASAIGLSNIPGTPIGDTDPAPALVPLIMASVTTLFFMTDQHWQVLRGLMNSYDVWHPGARLGGSMALDQLVSRLSEAFVLTLRIASPFIVYSVIVNLAVGLINKLTPAIPVYFISVPFVLFGGFLLLYLTSDELLTQFMLGVSSWLSE